MAEDTRSATSELGGLTEFVTRRLLALRAALETIAHDPSIGNPWAKSVARDALASDDRQSFRNPLGFDEIGAQ